MKIQLFRFIDMRDGKIFGNYGMLAEDSKTPARMIWVEKITIERKVFEDGS